MAPVQAPEATELRLIERVKAWLVRLPVHPKLQRHRDPGEVGRLLGDQYRASFVHDGAPKVRATAPWAAQAGG